MALLNNKRGMIIIGYPGIGKSSISSAPLQTIDLESSLYKENGDHIEDWYVLYCRQAAALAMQGYVVFVSSHKEVQEELRTYYIPDDSYTIVIVTPSLYLKDKWINKLSTRYMNTHNDKDYTSYEHVKYNYENDIKSMMSNDNNCFSKIVIQDIDYDLRKIVTSLRSIYCYHRPYRVYNESDED